jgi:hypothetical protein
VNREQWLKDRQEWLRPAGAQNASSGDFKRRMAAGTPGSIQRVQINIGRLHHGYLIIQHHVEWANMII